MRVLYLDCASGISGDMFVGAMLDAGLNFSFLQKELSKLKLKGYRIKKKTVLRHSIKGTKFDVLVDEKKRHRTLKEILAIINKSRLSEEVKKLSRDIFLNIGKAESRAHNTSLDKVHFHQIGDLDSIIDIVGAAIAIKELQIDRTYGSSLNLGKAAPATLNLAKGSRISLSGTPHELTTPTGAAIFKTLVKKTETPPAMDVVEVGYGAGTNNIEQFPNLLRIIIGEMDELPYDEDEVTVIETNIDDLKPMMYDYLIERLFKAGALDVFTTPAYMKKTRMGVLLTTLARCSDLKKMADIIFKETTTIGLRYFRAKRFVLKRETKKLKTKYGPINFKMSKIGDSDYRFNPEYEDCKKLAKELKLPLQKVYKEALEVCQVGK